MIETFVLRALAGGIGLALVAGPLGCFVVWRRMAYFGDAMAHASLLGIALGLLLDIQPMAAVVGLTLLLALLFVRLERQRQLASDTLLGLLAHGALAFGMLAIALLDRVRVDLLSYLFGDMLAIGPADLWAILALAVAGLGALALMWRPLLSATVHEDLAAVEGVATERVRLGFMLLVALVVAIGMKIAGLLLVVSLLIVPAATARRLARTPEQMAGLATAAGCLSVVLGLAGSLAWDLPSGPAVVAAAIVLFALAGLAGAVRSR